MSHSPFTPDPAVAGRIAGLSASIGATFSERVVAETSSTGGQVVPAAAVDRLVTEFGLGGPREAMLLALPAATAIARPPISGFFVGAVGLDAESGDLVLGGNVEFPGLDLWPTLHGEGFVAVRAFARDRTIGVLATGEARPCGHCRQMLSEFAAAPELELIDPLGHTLRLSDLYPWPFVPGDLEQPGIVPGAVPWPDLALGDCRLSEDVVAALVAAGRRAHAPYSGCPAAIVLRLADGRLVAGTTIESVAFNPTIGPLQAAIVELIAGGHAYADVVSATLATTPGGDVDPSDSIGSLLAVIAPEATLTITTWA